MAKTEAPETPFVQPEGPVILSQPEPSTGAQVPAVVLSEEEARIDTLVRDWVTGHIQNGPIARTPGAYEALTAALPALRAAILGG